MDSHRAHYRGRFRLHLAAQSRDGTFGWFPLLHHSLGHALTWFLLALSFCLRGLSPSLNGVANVIALVGVFAIYGDDIRNKMKGYSERS